MRLPFLATYLCIACLCRSQHAEWTQLAPFPGTARDDASSFTIGNTVFVGTGRDVSFALTNDWYAFDMVGLTWTTIAPLPASGRQYCAAFTDGAFGYLFGGVDANGPLNELWRYDPTMDAWEAMNPLPAAGRYAAVAFDNGFICTGLLNGGIPTNESWQYDIANASWSARAAVPGTARHRACGSGALIQVMGGSDVDGNALPDGYLYDSANDTWHQGPDPPVARIGADAVVDPDYGTTYMVAGASSSNTFHDDAWSMSDGAWTALPPFAGGARRGGVIAFGTAFGSYDRIIYYGTGTDGVQRYADWWSYTTLLNAIDEHQRTALIARPNPSDGTISFPGYSTSGPSTYSVHDHGGRIVLSGTLSADRAIDLTTLASGDYVIHITDGKRIFHSRASILRP